MVPAGHQSHVTTEAQQGFFFFGEQFGIFSTTEVKRQNFHICQLW